MTLPGWDATWKGQVAGHVVCSSVAAYAYGKAGVPHPPGGRGCQPGRLVEWVLRRGWESAT